MGVTPFGQKFDPHPQSWIFDMPIGINILNSYEPYLLSLKIKIREYNFVVTKRSHFQAPKEPKRNKVKFNILWHVREI